MRIRPGKENECLGRDQGRPASGLGEDEGRRALGPVALAGCRRELRAFRGAGKAPVDGVERVRPVCGPLLELEQLDQGRRLVPHAVALRAIADVEHLPDAHRRRELLAHGAADQREGKNHRRHPDPSAPPAITRTVAFHLLVPPRRARARSRRALPDSMGGAQRTARGSNPRSTPSSNAGPVIASPARSARRGWRPGSERSGSSVASYSINGAASARSTSATHPASGQESPGDEKPHRDGKCTEHRLKQPDRRWGEPHVDEEVQRTDVRAFLRTEPALSKEPGEVRVLREHPLREERQSQREMQSRSERGTHDDESRPAARHGKCHRTYQNRRSRLSKLATRATVPTRASAKRDELGN